MSQDWNNPDFQADIAREAMQADRKIAELRAQVAKMREALEKIAKVRRGLDLTDTDEYRVDYWSRLAQSYQNLARKALRDALSA